MKKIKFLIFILLTGGLIACSNDDDNNNTNDDNSNEATVTVNAVADLLPENSWMVSEFEKEGLDQTSYFNGYMFSFEDNEVVTASTDIASFTGSWNTTVDDNTPKLVLNFDENDDPFNELSEDWRIVTYNSTTIELENTSNEDYLIFSQE